MFEQADFPAPGSRVRITQKIVGRDVMWETRVEGEVLAAGPEPTGSWFARGKNDKLWRPRIRLRKADGEVSVVSLDQNSVIEVLVQPGANR